MGYSKFVLFKFASEESLRDETNISRLIYQITQETRFRFREDLFDDEFVENTPEVIRQVWSKVIDGGPPAYLYLSNLDRFKLTLGLLTESFKQMFVAVDSDFVSDLSPSNYKNVRALVQICELIYIILHPAYAYGFTSPEIDSSINNPNETIEVRAIHDYNFFGPEFVQRFGKEKLLSFPTWRTVQFNDGGVFLEMSPSPIADSERYTSNYQKAAEILGVEKFYQGG